MATNAQISARISKARYMNLIVATKFDAATIWLSIFALVTSPRRPAARAETTKFHADLRGWRTSVASE
jgi:hypothetical protein